MLFEAKEGASSEAVTDPEGNYRLMYDSAHAGCTPGTKIVRITLAGAGEEGADPDAAEGGEGAAPAETIPARYNSASTLTAEVSESNATFNFELQSGT